MLKFRTGDKVKVLSGKDKGREGKIEKIYPKKGTVLVPEINIFKKHVKSTREQKGGIFPIPRPLSFSKVQLICPKCGKPAKVGFKIIGEEKRRICKKCTKEIDSLTKAKKTKK